MPTDQGFKMININNIACIEDINGRAVVTLNVKNKSGDFISFTATLPIGTLTGEIQFMDNQ